jgi:hypothetical protein
MGFHRLHRGLMRIDWGNGSMKTKVSVQMLIEVIVA